MQAWINPLLHPALCSEEAYVKLHSAHKQWQSDLYVDIFMRKIRRYHHPVEFGSMLMHRLKIHHCVVNGMLWLPRQQLVHHLFSGRNVNRARLLRAPPPCCSASYFTLTYFFQIPPPLPISITYSLSFHHLHPSISCRSLSAGLGLLYTRHTWAVPSVWKWGSFAFKQSALWALGKLDERRMGRGGAKGVTAIQRKRRGEEGVCRELRLI